MKRLFGLFLLIILLPAGAVYAQDDCTADGVVASFADAVASGTVEDWARGYDEGDCPANIKVGARTLAMAHITLSAEAIPFAAPTDPATLNPAFEADSGGVVENTYSLDPETGALTIAAGPKTNIWGNTASLVTYPLTGDFEAVVNVAFDPVIGAVHKVAGLCVRPAGNPATWLRISMNNGEQIFFKASVNGEDVATKEIGYSERTAFLKIERSADLFTLLYSMDGSNWTRLQTYYQEMPDAVEVFFVVYATGEEGTSAEFRDFWVAAR
ncbi:MAG: DUF1349 domain-containing protein [Anaerolineae bacterium]|nr:DUF1349 domain-containing protein [Anaerolineae bacterium]